MTPDSFPSCLSRLIVIDIETSGLDVDACGILEIGAVPLDPARSGESYRCDVRLEWWMSWEAGAAAVHGIPKDEAACHPRLSEAMAMDQLLDWIDDTAIGDIHGRAIIAGMNPQFDLAFLRAAAARADMADRFRGLIAHRTLDMHSLAVAKMLSYGADPDSLNTDAIYEMLGQPIEAKPHRALEGARREAAAILELLDFLQ